MTKKKTYTTSEGYEFDKPLNEEILEEIEVKTLKPVFDGDNITFEEGTQKAFQRTTYIDVKPSVMMCPFQEHDFEPTEIIPQYKCQKCGFVTTAHPVTFKYNPKTKKLEYRV